MSLTGDVILDFFIIVIIEVLLAVGGTIAIFFVIAFVWTKIDEFFNRW